MVNDETVPTTTHPVAAPQSDQIEVVDLPLQQLIPVRKRTSRKAIYERLESNIRSIGLIEPLLVHPHQGQYFILDGYLRYLVLSDLGVTTVPCILISTLDSYTPNRQVNYLTMSQRWKMIQHALTVVDESRLKASLALKDLRHAFNAKQRDILCTQIQDRVRDHQLSRSAALHLVHVNEERQREILNILDQSGEGSSNFVRSQVLRTPEKQRVQQSEKTNPWNKSVEVHKKLADRLSDAERNADFYQCLYRQYAHDLTVLAIYARDLVSHKEIGAYLDQHFPDEVKLFREIMLQADDPEKQE